MVISVDVMEEATVVEVVATSVEDEIVVVDDNDVKSLSQSCISTPSLASRKQYSTIFFE